MLNFLIQDGIKNKPCIEKKLQENVTVRQKERQTGKAERTQLLSINHFKSLIEPYRAWKRRTSRDDVKLSEQHNANVHRQV